MERRAIVMGASSGMGREVARLLLVKGWHVGLGARRREALEELCNEYPQLAVAEQVDVTKPDAEERLLALIERLGGMDVYVHMAGIGKQNTALDPSIELATTETNGLGFTRMVGAAFRYFRGENCDEIAENEQKTAENDKKTGCKGGHIVAISSIAGTKRPWSCTFLQCHEGTSEHLSRSLGAALHEPPTGHQHHRYPSRICRYTTH